MTSMQRLLGNLMTFMHRLLAAVVECPVQAIQGRKGLFCPLVSEGESLVTLSIMAVGKGCREKRLDSQLPWWQSGREREAMLY